MKGRTVTNYKIAALELTCQRSILEVVPDNNHHTGQGSPPAA